MRLFNGLDLFINAAELQKTMSTGNLMSSLDYVMFTRNHFLFCFGVFRTKVYPRVFGSGASMFRLCLNRLIVNRENQHV